MWEWWVVGEDTYRVFVDVKAVFHRFNNKAAGSICEDPVELGTWEVFAELSVYENLKMGAYTRKDKNEIEESLANVYKRFPRLEERRNQMAGTLSGGEQQMLAMGRALMSKPKIILMDEPSMGLSPIFVNEIFDIIQAVSESGTTVLLVEQNAKKALSIADRAYVLETGKITMSGNAKDLLEDEAVKKAYLGE